MIANLNFNTNLISSIPASLFSLPLLKLLDISCNKLSGELSDAIGNCQALVELRASSNSLTSLPESIGDLKNLEVIDVRDNKIDRLP
jgi:Leucine-rich repeat (LRR) protein